MSSQFNATNAYMLAEDMVRTATHEPLNDVRKERIALSESGYRRGFQHGLQAAIEALGAGATPDDLRAYQGRLASWRFRMGKWAGTTYKMEPPPDWTGKGTF